MTDLQVLFEKKALASANSFLGCIRLNAPQVFNSLNMAMVQLIQTQLDKWADDATVLAVFLEGEGAKAFCAGGDVKSLYYTKVSKGSGIDNPKAIDFFDQEYLLDYALHTYNKPVICWGHGVVMGGGIGLMAGCTHRIVTDSSRIAMPEITIGLFPDVGASWFLNRAPGKAGLFLGLTGCNVNAHDAIYTGIANRFIADEFKDAVLAAILKLHADDFATGKLTELLKRFETQSADKLPASELKRHAAFINRVCDFENLDAIVDTIVKEAKASDSKWLQQAAATLESGCPVTAHLVHQQLQRGKHLSLIEVFNMERCISEQCMREPDFYEGVRALLIDKDKTPKWQHQHVAQVDKEFLEKYFISEIPLC